MFYINDNNISTLSGSYMRKCKELRALDERYQNVRNTVLEINAFSYIFCQSQNADRSLINQIEFVRSRPN